MKVLTLSIVAFIGWSVTIYAWAQEFQPHVADDPGDGGAVLAANVGLWMVLGVWLGGILLLALLTRTFWVHVRERARFRQAIDEARRHQTGRNSN